MRRCTRCGAVSPDTARTCQRCGASFQRQGTVRRSSNLRSTQTAPGTVPPKKKQRSFLVGLLALFGIRYDPQKGSWGCAFLPATISVALVVVVVGGIIVGPVLKLIPPFAPSLTVIGTVTPGASVIVHGTNFPPGSRINLTLDGVSIALISTSHRSTVQSLLDSSLSVAHANPLQQTEQLSAPTSDITVRNDGTFDAQVSIPTSWRPNSQHVIQAQAIGQDGRAQAQVQQTVTALSSPVGNPLVHVGPNPSACTGPFAGTSSGVVNVSLDKSGNSVNVSVHGALPNTTYVVDIRCVGAIGTFSTDSKGIGTASLDLPSTLPTTFYIDVEVPPPGGAGFGGYGDSFIAGPFSN